MIKCCAQNGDIVISKKFNGSVKVIGGRWISGTEGWWIKTEKGWFADRDLEIIRRFNE